MSDNVDIIIVGKDEFSKSFADANKQLDGLEKKTSSTSGMLDAVTGSMAGIATGGLALVGAAAVGAAGAALDFASDMQQGQRDIQASLFVTADEAENLGNIAKDVFANNWGESIGDVTDSLIDVRKQMKLLGDDELASATESALALRDTFGTDIAESTNAANTLMQNFGLTSEQAFDFITAGMQDGLDTSGDFLETIGEYSTQFKNGGASAEEFFNLMQSGSAGGMLGVDKAADAFKEFRVRIQDGSDATSTALSQLGIDSAQLGADMAAGTTTAADAFALVIQKLQETDDSTLRMQAGVGLLGTQFEDLGTDAVLGLDMAGLTMDDLAGATDSLNAKYGSLSSVATGLWRQLLVAIAPVGDVLLELANVAMPYVIAGFTSLKDGISSAITIIRTVVTTVFTYLSSFMTDNQSTMGTDLQAIWQQIQQAISLAVQLINQTVVPAFMAIAGFLSAHSTEINAILSTAWNMIMTIIRTIIGVITGILQAYIALTKGDFQGFMDAILGIVKALWNGVYNLFKLWLDLLTKLWLSVWTFMKTEFQKILDSIAPWIKQTMDAAKNTILQSISGIAGAAKSLGSNIISAIKDGVSGGVGALVSAVKDAASRALSAAKAFLGISSPSKEFMEVGGNIAAGWAAGVTAGVSDLTSAITGAASASLGTAAQTSSAAPAASPMTIMPGAIVVNGTAGQSAADIADMVMQRITSLMEGRA